MLMRFDPFRELDSLSQALANAPSISRSTLMAMDAYRDGDRLIIKLDLPGIDPNSIELTVEKNVLTVTAERELAPSDGQEYIVSERRQGKFTGRRACRGVLRPRRSDSHGACPRASQTAPGASPQQQWEPADRNDRHRSVHELVQRPRRDGGKHILTTRANERSWT